MLDRGTRRSPGTRRRRVASVVALLALVLGLAAGCAGSDGAGAPSSTTAPAPPRDVVVTITDGRFDPRRVEVAVGGSVTWVNDDVTEHLLVSTTPDVIHSPLIGKAGSWSRTFSTPGEIRYYCSIHNFMKGVVVVR